MMKGQGDDSGDMGKAKRKQSKSIKLHLSWDQILEWLAKTEPSKADFNAHLPETGGTDELGILLVLDQISRCRAKLSVLSINHKKV